MESKGVRYVDSLLPAEMARRAEDIGVAKSSMEFGRLFVLAVLAGAFIGFGAVLATTAAAGSAGVLPFGVARVLSGFVFSLGLVMVVIGGAELFTGNNLIVMAWANRRVSTPRILRNWAIVFVGNFVGAFGLAVLVFLSGQHLFGGGSVGAQALAIASAKSNLGFTEAIALGILCNILVCLAVWMSYSGRTTADKVIAVVPPVTAFVACGFEHSIANMYFIPAGMLIKWFGPEAIIVESVRLGADPGLITMQSFLVGNLLPVTIGNVIGGALFVGIVYWFVYLRKSDRSQMP